MASLSPIKSQKFSQQIFIDKVNGWWATHVFSFMAKLNPKGICAGLCFEWFAFRRRQEDLLKLLLDEKSTSDEALISRLKKAHESITKIPKLITKDNAAYLKSKRDWLGGQVHGRLFYSTKFKYSPYFQFSEPDESMSNQDQQTAQNLIRHFEERCKLIAESYELEFRDRQVIAPSFHDLFYVQADLWRYFDDSAKDFYEISIFDSFSSHACSIEYNRDNQEWTFFDSIFGEFSFQSKKDCRDYIVKHVKEHYPDITAIMIDSYELSAKALEQKLQQKDKPKM